jgi:hypothetical protein
MVVYLFDVLMFMTDQELWGDLSHSQKQLHLSISRQIPDLPEKGIPRRSGADFSYLQSFA